MKAMVPMRTGRDEPRPAMTRSASRIGGNFANGQIPIDLAQRQRVGREAEVGVEDTTLLQAQQLQAALLGPLVAQRLAAAR